TKPDQLVNINRLEDVMESLQVLARRLGTLCEARGIMVVTAESCTGGWVAQTITETPGSSKWFDGGYVTYSNSAKHRMLGVPENILHNYGAVSEETVEAMALGAIKDDGAQLSVSVSGIAGPEGGTPSKPVGTVWFAWAVPGKVIQTALCQFD